MGRKMTWYDDILFNVEVTLKNLTNAFYKTTKWECFDYLILCNSLPSPQKVYGNDEDDKCYW